MQSSENIVRKAVKKYGKGRENLLPILQMVRKENNYLSEDQLREIATEMDLSAADVYGVATFYSFMDMQPKGKNIIRICKTITCFMKGKDSIVTALEDALGIKMGETTPDRKFSLLEANCIGWCHKGPAMLINDKVYVELTPEKAIQALEEYR
ncbi:MAG: NADH-quinone oxidoreductase subunit NuoE [Candidatus Marinimicrobia bacterium]|nr:NADH-quinone oxidoreductase subunit NuoE [Candidatus Neomarinimicrobiota bacterium]MDD5581738.1 NADH-quinone oxidoreductase subunit NuoE [Candidatus Neomarinimicrobiota bacterium]